MIDIQSGHLLFEKLAQQIYLVAFSMAVAIIIGMPLGIIIQRSARLRHPVMAIANILQTIPSLALLALLLPLLGIGALPAIVALSLYSLLPIIRNTYVGLDSVPNASLEAAHGLGFNYWQRLWIVELPLALPTIVAGVRTATAISVGIATLAAFIGAGGLGDFINQGLQLNNTQLILMGAIPAALLALVLDFFIGAWERSFLIGVNARIRRYLIPLCLLVAIFLVTFFGMPRAFARNQTVRVASKNFTESVILGNILSQLISAKTKLHVDTRFSLGATSICQKAMEQGDIDMYPEYTGTAYLMVLHHKYNHSSSDVKRVVEQEYKKRFDFVWLPFFGFSNSEAVLVRRDFANQYHLKTIQDLAVIQNRVIYGGPPEVTKRADALPGLEKAYKFVPRRVVELDPGLMYKALANNNVNAISGFSTDGRIEKYHLIHLQDNLNFYPPYAAGNVVREQILKLHPELVPVLKSLSGKINDQTIRHLNYEVDVEKKLPATVAHEFLVQRGFIKS